MSTEDIHKPSSLAFSDPGLAVFLLFGCLIIGLLFYIWALISQRHKLPAFKNFLVLFCRWRTSELRGVQHIYHAAFLLLVFDGFTVIFGLVWGILLFCGTVQWVTDTCGTIWLVFRYLSQCQHLITALISILFAYHPSWKDGLLDASRGLLVVPVMSVILSVKITGGILVGVHVYNFLLVVAIVISWCLPTSSPIANERNAFGAMSVVFYLLICLPTAITKCMLTYSHYYVRPALDSLLFTNFHVVMSAVLFRMVLKLPDGNPGDNHQHEGMIESPVVASESENPLAPVKALPWYKILISATPTFLRDSYSYWFPGKKDKKVVSSFQILVPCDPEKEQKRPT